MSEQFDWQTEDDDAGWDDLEPVAPPTAVSRKLSWRTTLTILGLLLLVGFVLNWQYNRRIEALTTTIEMDVLSTHNLIQRAVERQDLELLAPLLSAKSLSWTQVQEALMTHALFYDRAQLDLTLVSDDGAAQPLALADGRYLGIDVQPDLNEVVLSFRQAYLPGAEGEAVLLEQTAVYRRGSSRWLLSPPSAEFWGEWKTTETENLTLVYPARDAEIAAQLAEDLTQTILQACQTLAAAAACPPDFQVQLRLDSDPASLLEAADPTTLYDGNLRLNLPTPTLVGLPLDETGYQAVLRAYAAPVMTVIINEAVGWECCAKVAIYQAFMDYQLAQLGLRPWPVTRETYTNVVNSSTALEDVFSLWLEPAFSPKDKAESWKIYAFVDYLMRSKNAPPAFEMLQSLNERQTFQDWLADFDEADSGFYEPGIVMQDRVSRDWWLDAQVQMLISQEPLPLPFPDQDLMLSCANVAADDFTSSLVRYQLASHEWQSLHTINGISFISPLPNDTAVVIDSLDINSEMWRVELLQNGERLPLVGDEYSNTLSWGQLKETESELIVFASQTGNEDFLPTMVNTSTCGEEGCTFTPLSGVPVVSPNGSQSLLVTMNFLQNGLIYSNDGRAILFDAGEYFQNFPLSRTAADGGATTPIPLGGVLDIPGGGDLPFWVDDETYGFVNTTSMSDASQVIVLASVADDSPTIVATTADLLATVNENKRPFRLSIRFVYAHPHDPNLLFVVANSRLDSYLFIIDLKNGLIENPFQFPSAQSQFFGLSPNGRHLLLSGGPPKDFTGPQDVITYYLYDITRNKTQTFITSVPGFAASYSFDWSADGSWLALTMNDGAISLVAPEYNYQYLLQHDKGECSSLAWLNPETE